MGRYPSVWGNDDNSPDGKRLARWESTNSLPLVYNAKDVTRFCSGRCNPGTNPDLAFDSVGPNIRLPDRSILRKLEDLKGTCSQDMIPHSAYLQAWRLELSHTKMVTAAFYLNNRETKHALKVYNSYTLLPFYPTPSLR